jgi:hypothetical protein
MAGYTDGSVLPVLISEWPRNAREMLRIKLDVYRGNAVVDRRCWYPDKATGEMKPGRGGVTLAVKHLPDLAAALGAAVDEVRRLGFAAV